MSEGVYVNIIPLASTPGLGNLVELKFHPQAYLSGPQNSPSTIPLTVTASHPGCFPLNHRIVDTKITIHICVFPLLSLAPHVNGRRVSTLVHSKILKMVLVQNLLFYPGPITDLEWANLA